MRHIVNLVFSLLIGILFYLVLTLLYGCPQAKASCFEAQDIQLKSTIGKTHTIKQYRGKVVVVSFWATWCKPCLAELKYLNKLAEKNKDKMVVLAISIDGPQTQARVNQKIRRFKNITVLLDPSGATNPTSQVPYTIFVNTLGKQCYDKRGFIRGDEQEIENKVNELNGASSR